MKRLIGLIHILCLALIHVTCPVSARQMSEQDYHDEIKRIVNLNPQQQALKGIGLSELTIYVFYDRGGLHVPGFNEENIHSLNDRCVTLVMRDIGGVIASDTHYEYYKTFMEYAVAYNKMMRDYCIDDT